MSPSLSYRPLHPLPTPEKSRGEPTAPPSGSAASGLHPPGLLQEEHLESNLQAEEGSLNFAFLTLNKWLPFERFVQILHPALRVHEASTMKNSLSPAPGKRLCPSLPQFTLI